MSRCLSRRFRRVAIRWCFESGARSYADSVLNRPAIDDTAKVPVLDPTRRAPSSLATRIPACFAAPKAEFAAERKSLSIIADDLGVACVLTGVQRLALSYRPTSYDAAYLGLTLRLDLPLATLDDELIVAARDAGVSILL